jgi:predicted signal transduction protein with EAL and GGDEF domain
MRLACKEFSKWRSRGLGLDAVMRINVSPVQLVTDDFVETVAATLDEFGLDGPAVCLEITKSVVVQDIESTRDTLDGLKNVGVQIAVDDFGTGYSVLTYLKSFPIDTLKIDRSFVRDLGTNQSDLSIVRAILALADAFDLHLVAEGVETPTAATTLLDLGVDARRASFCRGRSTRRRWKRCSSRATSRSTSHRRKRSRVTAGNFGVGEPPAAGATPSCGRSASMPAASRGPSRHTRTGWAAGRECPAAAHARRRAGSHRSASTSPRHRAARPG